MFGLPEVTLGLIPAWGGVPNLVRACGPGRALDVCLGGRPLSATDALALNVVQRVVPPDQLGAVATQLAVRVAGWSPAAVAGILELAGAAGASWERELELFETALNRPEAGAALARFLTKRAA